MKSDCQTEVAQRAEGLKGFDTGRWTASECGPTVVELAVKTCGCVRPKPGLGGAVVGKE